MTAGGDAPGGGDVDLSDDPAAAVRERVADRLTVPDGDRGRRVVHEPTGTELVSVRRFEPTRRIDRDSEFATQFERPVDPDGGTVDDGTSSGLYAGWFKSKLLEDDEFAAALSDLYGERLGCHCLPQPCHGEVILEHLAEAHDG
ncbi:MAG: DUF4326 domain-containing protein [Haloferacaceae archaeon]